MINFIVFSFNRALQLDTLIRSMKKFVETDYHIYVIYNATSTVLQDGYDLLIDKYRDVTFLKENDNNSKPSLFSLFNFRNLKTYIKYSSVRKAKTNFRSLTIEAIRTGNPEFVCFFTDDSVMIDKFVFPNEIKRFINEDKNQNSYSLRLGMSINNCPMNPKIGQDYFIWSFDEFKKGHWRYRFSVDGHIYSKEIIDKLLNKLIFQNPNTLEPAVFDYSKNKNLISKCMCPMRPSLISFPLNEVNTDIRNFALNVSCETLNSYLLNGFELSYKVPDLENLKEFQQFESEIYFTKEDIIETLKLK